jgi:hypothetical protein
MAGWTTPRTWVAGEKPTAATMNAHVRDNLTALNGFVRKTADESVTSSATLQNDNELSIAIPAAGTYEITLNLRLQSAASSAGDFAPGATFPAGTMIMSIDGLDTSIGAVSNGVITRRSEAITSGVDPGLDIGCSSAPTLARITFLFIATASGTFQFQWAQSASNANATTVLANSTLTMVQRA